MTDGSQGMPGQQIRRANCTGDRMPTPKMYLVIVKLYSLCTMTKVSLFDKFSYSRWNLLKSFCPSNDVRRSPPYSSSPTRAASTWQSLLATRAAHAPYNDKPPSVPHWKPSPADHRAHCPGSLHRRTLFLHRPSPSSIDAHDPSWPTMPPVPLPGLSMMGGASTSFCRRTGFPPLPRLREPPLATRLGA
jgi:hypothetical protein